MSALLARLTLPRPPEPSVCDQQPGEGPGKTPPSPDTHINHTTAVCRGESGEPSGGLPSGPELNLASWLTSDSTS